MALTCVRKYNPGALDGAHRAKEAMASYRGLACGVRYAETLWATAARVQDIL